MRDSDTPLNSPLPAELEGEDADRMGITILLFAHEGYLDQLQVFRWDGLDFLALPAADAFRDLELSVVTADQPARAPRGRKTASPQLPGVPQRDVERLHAVARVYAIRKRAGDRLERRVQNLELESDLTREASRCHSRLSSVYSWELSRVPSRARRAWKRWERSRLSATSDRSDS